MFCGGDACSRLSSIPHSGIIRVGSRCQNEAIRPFSLVNARRQAHENRSIPRHIYFQKHTIRDRKAEAEEVLKQHSDDIERSRTTILPLSTFIHCDLIDMRHSSALLDPYEGNLYRTALPDWLGLGHDYVYMPDDANDHSEIDQAMSEVSLSETSTEEQATGQEGDDEGQQGTKKEGEAEEQDEEEEEEEQRRRDELELDQERFIPSAVKKPTTAMPEPMNEQGAGASDNHDDGDDGQGAWQVVQKKPHEIRRLIMRILGSETTLTDETVKAVPDDVWQLTYAQRHDLYRYWLLKYQQYFHRSLRDARREYNQAVAALDEYHQEEDYYHLKDSAIVAMTTTCAAKYHSVLEKLRKQQQLNLELDDRVILAYLQRVKSSSSKKQRPYSRHISSPR